MAKQNGINLSNAEFKGTVIESLSNIKENINEIKLNNKEQHKEFYVRLRRLEKKGYPPVTRLNVTMSLEDMDEIVSIQREERSLENSIRLQGDILTGVISGTEKLNSKFDPADIKLDGWSESFYENIDNYDEVFEDLYYKYNEKIQLEPEIKLIGMVLGSGMAFHFSKTVFDNAKDTVPGFENIMEQRPDIAQAYREAALNIMGQPQHMSHMPHLEVMRYEEHTDSC